MYTYPNFRQRATRMHGPDKCRHRCASLHGRAPSPSACTVNHIFQYLLNTCFRAIRSTTEDIVIPKGTIIVNVKIAPERATTPRTMQRVQLIIDSNLPFEEGGPPTTAAHLQELGLDLSTAIDPNRPKKDGGYELLTEAQRNQLIQPALRWWWVWSRDARVPEVSRLVVIDIPTGDAIPVAQKPYPIPYQYRDAVIDELRKLLHGGLIEPTISQWASPLLVRLKKDSTPDKIRLKCIIDYRQLNQITGTHPAAQGRRACPTD
jgi:hypothetical protein